MKFCFKRWFFIKKLTFVIFWLLGTFAYANSAPAPSEVIAQIYKQNNYISSVRQLWLWKEMPEWYIYQGMAYIGNTEKIYRDFYVYIKPDTPIETMKIRLHNFASFPFPIISYSEYLNIKRNPNILNQILFPILGEDQGQSFQRSVLNNLTMDFGHRQDQRVLFYKEKEYFVEVKEQYLPQLKTIERWNEQVQTLEQGLLTVSKDNPMRQDPEFQKLYELLEEIGIDFMLPYVVESDCTSCFSLVGSFSPNNNYGGFFWINDEDLLPQLDPNNVFYMEPLGDGWYIFQST